MRQVLLVYTNIQDYESIAYSLKNNCSNIVIITAFELVKARELLLERKFDLLIIEQKALEHLKDLEKKFPISILLTNDEDYTFEIANSIFIDYIPKSYLQSSSIKKIIAAILYKIDSQISIANYQDKLYKILNTLADAIIILNADFSIQYINTAASKLLTINAESIENKQIYDFFTASVLNIQEESMALFKELLNNCFKKKKLHILEKHISYTDKNEHEHFLKVTICPFFSNDNQDINFSIFFRDCTEQFIFTQDMQYKTTHDILTKLPNKKLFLDRLGQSISYCDRYNNKLAVLLINLNRFKKTNNRSGDQLLMEVVSRIKKLLHTTDTIARINDDQFTVMLYNINKFEDAGYIAEFILKELSLPCSIANKPHNINATIGIATYPSNNTNIENIIANAEKASTSAKMLKKNYYKFYDKPLHQSSITTITLTNELRMAIPKKQFKLFFQPQFKIEDKTTKIIAFEALLRWLHPKEGYIPPQQFILDAEKSGFIDMLGRWVFIEVCKNYKIWKQNGFNTLKVAINFSIKQFSKEDLVNWIINTVEKYSIDPKYIQIEIIGSFFLNDTKGIANKLLKLKEKNFTIVIDNFGAGYSCLSYLKDLPIDFIKLDRSFICTLPDNNKDKAIVKTIIDLANNLDISVSAKGIETESQKDYLSTNGCHNLQGYLFSKPIPASEVIPYLRSL